MLGSYYESVKITFVISKLTFKHAFNNFDDMKIAF